MKNFRSNERRRFRFLGDEGISLIEVLVAFGLMSIMALFFSQMLVSQNTETRALTERLAVLDLQRQLIGAMSNTRLCTRELTDAGFNPWSAAAGGYVLTAPIAAVTWAFGNGLHEDAGDTSPYLIDLRPAFNPRRLAHPSLSQTLAIDRVVMEEFQLVGAALNGYYRARLKVFFNPQSTVRVMRPIVIPVHVIINPLTQRPWACVSGERPTRYQLNTIFPGPGNQSMQLGTTHRYCSLMHHHAPHEAQACSCFVETDNFIVWRLRRNMDPSVAGACGCAAICFD